MTDSLFPDLDLTPTEDLILEVLIARRRLGEHLWTFDSKVKKQISSLADKGLVMEMNGIVENTVRAMLTDEAFAQFCSYKYVPPIAKENTDLAKPFKKIYKKAKAMKERFLSSSDK